MFPIVEGNELLPVVDNETKLKKYPAIGGYPVLDAIMKTEPKEYQKLLMTKSQDMPIWIGTVKFSDTLDDVLRIFETTRSGNVVVEREDNNRTILSLKDIAELFEVDKIRSDLRVYDVGSQKISAPKDTTIVGALKVMFDNKIRRVFCPSYKNERLRFVSSRNLIEFLFSPKSLERCKENPESWLDEKVSTLPGNNATQISDEETVNQASRLIGKKSDACLVSNVSNRVISRWDIVMKSWKLGGLQS